MTSAPKSNSEPNANTYNPQGQILKFLTVVRRFQHQLITTYMIEEDAPKVAIERELGISCDPDEPAPDPGPSTKAERAGELIATTLAKTKHFVFRYKKVCIFLSSLHRDSKGTMISEFLKKEMGNFHMIPIVLDPREMMEYLLQHPSQVELNDPKMTPPWLEKYNKEILCSSGFIVLCPEYETEGSLPGPLTAMLDLFPPESFCGKPCGLISYAPGDYHGDHHVDLLREHLSIFNTMVPLPFNAIIPNVKRYFNEDGTTHMKIKYGEKVVNHILEDLYYCLKHGHIRRI